MAHKRISIITITYNNLSGLRKTAESVERQSYRDFEWIIVDGASTDGTKEYLEQLHREGAKFVGEKEGQSADWADGKLRGDALQIRMVSEPDKGVYDAQNKGIRLATGDYCFFLNAGDCFCNGEVLAQIFGSAAGKETHESVCGCGESGRQCGEREVGLPIVYGNEVVVDATGKRVDYCRGVENPGFVDLYNSCMKHQATFIPRALFAQYGDYDISLRICADWEWFFRVIAFHNDVRLCYKDVDVSYFEEGGISSRESGLVQKETEIIYNRYVPKRLQADYSVFMRYGRLRLADQSGVLRFMLHVVLYLAKHCRWLYK